DLQDLLVNEFGGGAGDGDAGELGLQDLLDLDLGREGHEEDENDEDHVDHRGDLKADVGVGALNGQFHRGRRENRAGLAGEGGEGDVVQAGAGGEFDDVVDV